MSVADLLSSIPVFVLVLFRIAGMMLFSPLLVFVALAVRATSAGPALFVQTRVGKNGKPFRMIKFRSMVDNAEAQLASLKAYNEVEGGTLFKIKADPRVTRVGRVIRRFSIDEIPQLFNVLLGQMSLVGPRPPLPQEVAQYADDVRRRLAVKPGMTLVFPAHVRHWFRALGTGPLKTYGIHASPHRIVIEHEE